MRIRTGMLFSVLCAVVGLGAAAAPASALTIGQVAPPEGLGVCSGGFTLLQPTVTSGPSYEVPPGYSRITAWSTRATAGLVRGAGNPELTFEVLRKTGEANTYRVVARDIPRTYVDGEVNRFAVDIAVIPGDLIGLYADDAPASFACDFQQSGETDWYYDGDLAGVADGAVFQPSNGGYRLNLSAELADPPPPQVPPVDQTGRRARALKKCKKKHSKKKRKKCRKRARRLSR